MRSHLQGHLRRIGGFGENEMPEETLCIRKKVDSPSDTSGESPHELEIDATASILECQRHAVNQTLKHTTEKIIDMSQRYMQDGGASAAAVDHTSFSVRLILEEALTNAFKHAHEWNPAKVITVSWTIRHGILRCTIRDQGMGYEPKHIPDPRDPANIELIHGRGHLLMKTYANRLTIKRDRRRGGMVVTLTKRLRKSRMKPL